MCLPRSNEHLYDRFMLRIICCILLICSFFSCKKKNTFEVSGTITGAEGQMLFLEENALDRQLVVDSVVLPPTGEFLLKAPCSQVPEFYKLRLGKEQIHLVVESTERIIISASADSLYGYQITGSDANIRIKELYNIVRQTNDRIKKEKERYETTQDIPQDSLYAVIVDIINDYKAHARQIIVSDMKSPAAYFAIFQKLAYNITPFSLSNKDDLKYYTALANAWNMYYKESLRTKQLHNLVTYGQETIKKEGFIQFAEEYAVGYIDISLPDRNNKMRSLASLNGNVILLDFCSYLQLTPYDIIELRDLYSKNHKKNFEIYQVSFDRDIQYWKNTVEKLPWVCVNDSSFSTALIYNVTELPTNYLIDKHGNIVGRNLTPDAIRSYLGRIL